MSGQRWATYLFLTNRSRPYAASVSMTITMLSGTKRGRGSVSPTIFLHF